MDARPAERWRHTNPKRIPAHRATSQDLTTNNQELSQRVPQARGTNTPTAIAKSPQRTKRRSEFAVRVESLSWSRLSCRRTSTDGCLLAQIQRKGGFASLLEEVAQGMNAADAKTTEELLLV